MKKFEFKIIAGSLKGASISAPDLGVTRPPLTRIRRSIFDYLNPFLPDASYLDLFSGTGSYLFEAISRGVHRAVGVELEARLSQAITDNAERLNVASQLDCRCQDVFEAIPALATSGDLFDIMMIAPPQYVGLIDKTLDCLVQNRILSDRGLILCQHDTSEKRINWGTFIIDQQRRYGNTTFTILRA